MTTLNEYHDLIKQVNEMLENTLSHAETDPDILRDSPGYVFYSSFQENLKRYLKGYFDFEEDEAEELAEFATERADFDIGDEVPKEIAYDFALMLSEKVARLIRVTYHDKMLLKLTLGHINANLD